MNETDKAVTGYDKPISAQKSLDEAWQRAFDKHGEQYANDIFPGGKAVTGEGEAPRVKLVKFELKPDGSVERVGPFGSYGRPVIEAQTKTEANARFLQFAFRASENSPKVKIRNGAYQLAYESLSYGVSVESGVEGRDMSLCFSGAADWSAINDTLASFDYYASEEYQKA